MVFYRKYRPQTLEDLIGQDQIKSTLQNAFKQDKLAHAYLFCGPRGCGKTSTARVLAKMVNCEKYSANSTEPVPCNTCSSCVSITDGSNMDVIEIDAASNRGIDDIRELRERVKLAPSSAKKKVYIIDEVHMLTTEAFNALLKTLEEPPAHVLFILATTEIHKIPQTILSRVQKLEFKLAANQDLVKMLSRVAKEEKIDVEEEALKLIAKSGEGSFRDALKVLDQLASQGEKITKEVVEKQVRSGNFTQNLELLGYISASDAKQSLEMLQRQLEQGVSVKEFTTQILEMLRFILLIKNHAEVSLKDEVGTANFEQLVGLAQTFGQGKLLKTINAFGQSLEKLKYTSIPSLPLEVAVVESCSPEPREMSQVPQIQMIRQIVEVSGPRDIPSDIYDGTDDIRTEKLNGDNSPKTNPNTEEVLVIKDKWSYILETIRPDNFSLEALLRQAKLMGYEGNAVILEVPYAFHQRILEAPRARNLLESVLTDVLGKPSKVITKIGKRPVRVEELANVELAQDDEIVRIAAEIFNS